MSVEQILQAERLIEELEADGLLTGYDYNVLREWKEQGGRGERPMLSFELTERYRAEEAEADAEQQSCGLHNWLVEARRRQDKESEAKLLREYPVSYPAYVESLRLARLEEAAVRQKKWLKQAQLDADLKRLSELQHAHERSIKKKVDAYVFWSGSLDAISSAEYIEYVESLANEIELERLTKRLEKDAKALRSKDDPDRIGLLLDSPCLLLEKLSTWLGSFFMDDFMDEL